MNPSFSKESLKDKKVAVIGAARSGIAAARLLKKYGAVPFVSDASTTLNETAECLLNEAGIPFETGGHSSKVFEVDIMVVSPGVPFDSPVQTQAREKNIPVFGELEVGSWLCQAPIIGVTGSNGKSTVTSLIGAMLRDAGIPSIVAGNIGDSFTDHVESVGESGAAVVEISSFQLETIDSFHPHVGVYLNLTPDHLDRHGTLENYGSVKARLFENQSSSDYAILNGLDENVQAIADKVKSRVISFGRCIPNTPCLYEDEGVIYYHDQVQLQEVIPVQEMSLIGTHNVLNAMAATAAAIVMGIDLESIRNTLRTFQSLPHRLEFVREVNGVRFYNDSKATNVDSVKYALESYTDPVLLIAGGRDKNSDFSLLHGQIQKHVKAAVVIGEASEKMAEVWKDDTSIVKADSLRDAVTVAYQRAQKGDVVLLSPACASFDMFLNFEDRGNTYKTIVKSL